jgi:N-acetylmuramoyl-L-alanine amidase
MPGVLVETGFLTNSEEEKYLGSESGQEYLASAIFRAFRLYKESIESKSHFETVAEKADAEALQNTSNEALITNNIVDNKSINFKIQILSTKNPLKLDDPYFKNYKFAEEFKNGKWYKYAIGGSSSYEETLKFSTEVKKDFPDAFVIAVKNGEIVNLKQALEEIKN